MGWTETFIFVKKLGPGLGMCKDQDDHIKATLQKKQRKSKGEDGENDYLREEKLRVG